MRIYLARPFRSRSFFNDTATTEIYTLSLHDALPIYTCFLSICCAATMKTRATPCGIDRKSTRLNSSHLVISYAVFCLKKIIYAARGEDPAHRHDPRHHELPQAPCVVPAADSIRRIVQTILRTGASRSSFFFFLTERPPPNSPPFPPPAPLPS